MLGNNNSNLFSNQAVNNSNTNFLSGFNPAGSSVPAPHNTNSSLLKPRK